MLLQAAQLGGEPMASKHVSSQRFEVYAGARWFELTKADASVSPSEERYVESTAVIRYQNIGMLQRLFQVPQSRHLIIGSPQE
jgi:hypothetical protein